MPLRSDPGVPWKEGAGIRSASDFQGSFLAAGNGSVRNGEGRGGGGRGRGNARSGSAKERKKKGDRKRVASRQGKHGRADTVRQTAAVTALPSPGLHSSLAGRLSFAPILPFTSSSFTPPHFASSNMSNPSSRQPISNAAGIETRRSIDNELVQEAVGKGNSTVHGKNPLAPNGPFDTHPVSLSFFEDCKSVSGSVTHI